MLSLTKYESNLIVHGSCSPSHYNGLTLKICQNFVLAKIFLTFVAGYYYVLYPVWNYYIHENECVGLTVNFKNWYVWNIQFLKHHIPSSLYSVGILVLNTLNTLSLCFQVLTTTTFPFMTFPTFSFLCLFL